MSRLLILGTRNKKKGLELAELLGPHGFELRTLADIPGSIEVAETGETFAANAILKASQQAVHLGSWVLGEDSGLSVDALDGAPGVYSARFSPEGTDAANNALLLERLRDVPREGRGAHYTCRMALADPSGAIRVECEDYCHGRIRLEPSGSGGFGYDPLFEVLEYHRTFGELGSAVKTVLSHRARAARQFLPRVLELVRGATW